MLQMLTLDSGYMVRCRPVPPHANLTLYLQTQDKLPPTPEQPMVFVKSVAGHSEQVPASQDSPEWLAYQQALRVWSAIAAEIQQGDQVRHTNFRLSYCILAWKPPLPWFKRILWQLLGKSRWQTTPPEDWVFPSALTEYGVAIPGEQRIDFIHYELLATNRDVEAIMNVSMGGAELTSEEVDAVAEKFRAVVERRKSAAEVAANGDTSQHVSGRDVNSKAVE